jgi:hypothetical protein
VEWANDTIIRLRSLWDEGTKATHRQRSAGDSASARTLLWVRRTGSTCRHAPPLSSAEGLTSSRLGRARDEPRDHPCPLWTRWLCHCRGRGRSQSRARPRPFRSRRRSRQRHRSQPCRRRSIAESWNVAGRSDSLARAASASAISRRSRGGPTARSIPSSHTGRSAIDVRTPTTRRPDVRRVARQFG